jgi:uncharacterized heparinase superfamily protein
MSKVLQKLKGRSLTELGVRGGQAAACLAERAGLSQDTRVPDDAAFFRLLDASQFGSTPLASETLFARFRERPSHPFFAAFNAPEETRAVLDVRFGASARAALVERAERIVGNRFDLLGLNNLDFGDPIDWHLEPVAGKRTPLAHWSRIDYLNASVAGDKKIIWELNRQQYFTVLGRAYWHTGDERYAEIFARHLDAWTRANPPKRGINWASSLEVAFRSISWLWSLEFFKHSTHLTHALYTRALKFLYLHARHLETNLSTYFSPNTHLTGEALGLFYLGTLLPEFRRAARWRAVGRRILLAELERQIRPDGTYFEQTSYYQRYTADFYLHFLALLRADQDVAARESRLKEKLSAALDHLMHLTLPDGTTPLFGDDDGGRLAPFDERPADDFRATLATGAALLKRADYKYVAREATEETLWLLGARGLADFDALEAQTPARQSRAFTDGGYYVMRDGWTSDSNYLLLDCGPHGALNNAHAHADALAILACAARGASTLVDSGTYTYTGSAALRDAFRATAAHNALTIDGESSSVSDGAFRWRQTARSVCRNWMSRARFDLFDGEHDGYTRLPAPAKHARSVLFIKGDYWIMRDRVETSGTHEYELNFHFDARSRPSIETCENTGAKGEVAATLRAGAGSSPGLDLHAFANLHAFARIGGGGAWRRRDELHSTCYGAARPAPVCTFAFAGGAAEAFTFLIPHATGAARSTAREIETVGGRAFELRQGTVRDVLMVRAEGALRVETAQLDSDFDWTWLRFRGEETEPRELIAVGGQRLRLDGREIVRAVSRINYVAAHRSSEGEDVPVDTDAGEGLFLALSGAWRVEEQKGVEIQ